MNNALTLKLDRARWFVLQHSPFYGQLCMALADVVGNPHGKTACTDGTRIMWDADFLSKLTDEETRFVLLHETLHCAHGHLWRFPVGQADHSKANQACDHAINLTLNASTMATGKDKSIAMPKGGLADNRFTGMAEEDIYAALPEPPPQSKGKQGDGQGQSNGDPCGDYCEPSQDGKQPASGQQKQEMREQWERAVIQAAQAAKATGKGDVPADMERILDKLAAQPINWREETAQFIKNAASGRNDWTRSPRRHAWQSVIYPRRKADAIGCIVGVRDTSGSIRDKLAAEFSAILQTACCELGCDLILIDCDAAIQAEYRIGPCGDVPLTAKGGGGTDFAAPFARAKELADSGERIAGLIYLTDLQGSGQPQEEEIPTLWLTTTELVAETGRTVRIL